MESGPADLNKNAQQRRGHAVMMKCWGYGQKWQEWWQRGRERGLKTLHVQFATFKNLRKGHEDHTTTEEKKCNVLSSLCVLFLRAMDALERLSHHLSVGGSIQGRWVAHLSSLHPDVNTRLRVQTHLTQEVCDEWTLAIYVEQAPYEVWTTSHGVWLQTISQWSVIIEQESVCFRHQLRFSLKTHRFRKLCCGYKKLG